MPCNRATHTGPGWEKRVEASVARCLRTPPDRANGQGLNRSRQAALRSEASLSIVVICNYSVGPMTVVPCRAKALPLRPRRSCFAPIISADSMGSAAFMVEALGTAPGSDRFIAQSIYCHSRSDRRYEYKRSGRQFQSVCRRLRYHTPTSDPRAAFSYAGRRGDVRMDVNGMLSQRHLITGPVIHKA